MKGIPFDAILTEARKAVTPNGVYISSGDADDTKEQPTAPTNIINTERQMSINNNGLVDLAVGIEKETLNDRPYDTEAQNDTEIQKNFPTLTATDPSIVNHQDKIYVNDNNVELQFYNNFGKKIKNFI